MHFSEKTIRELLNKYGFKFSKSMGQNFLIDGNIPEKIVRLSGIDEGCGVLEVGPGIGALTIELSRAAGRVTAVELDGRLLPILEEILIGQHNVDIVRGDILKLDIKKLVNEVMPGLKHHVCANLPYNITTPTLTAFISAGVFETITVMVQREVARRICADPGSKDYGAFSVYAQFHTKPQTLFDVPPECFMPRPKVFSSVVIMHARNERILSPEVETLFFSVVRAAFGQRRKTLANALFSAFASSIGKAEISEIIVQCGFDPLTRGETLSIEDFSKLTKQILFLQNSKK